MPKLWIIQEGQVMISNFGCACVLLCSVIETPEEPGPHSFRASFDEDRPPLPLLPITIVSPCT